MSRVRTGIRNCHRPGLVGRVGARLLMRRPWAGHGLTRDLKVVDELRPGPDGRALARLRRVFDQLVQARITLAVAAGLDAHAHAPAWRAGPPSMAPAWTGYEAYRPTRLSAPQRANNLSLN